MPPTQDKQRQDGILPIQRIQEAAKNGTIHSDFTIPAENFQPASLDLRLGETAYSLQSSFLPYAGPVASMLPKLTIAQIDIRDGAVLEKNRPYLIPLLERLELPGYLQAKANPKSSTGRLDIFTRVITDNNQRFDTIPPGYWGPMYIEVFSRSFTIRVQTRLSLNQIRLFQGNPNCQPGEIADHHSQHSPVVFPNVHEPTQDNNLYLTIELTSSTVPVGYRARKNSSLLDLSRRDHYRSKDFWEPVFSEDDKTLILEPEEFYLLAAAESVAIPPAYAAEMSPYETSMGELRTHYAGFFDPGFGYGQPSSGKVIPALEVRAHDVPFLIGPGQTVAALTFQRMLAEPERIYGPATGSFYQTAGRILSKQFRND